MTTIENKELVYNETLLLADDQEASFSVSVNDAKLPVSLRFSNPTDATPHASWRSEGGVLKVECTGWNNPLGAAVKAPQKFGDVGGNSLYLLLAHHRVGEMNQVHFQILKGGA